MSISQIATIERERDYIIDLIKLYKEKQYELDNFLKIIFYSSNIMKLGMVLI